MDIFKLSYQCNLCKPKVSVISANVESRSNLKRHLSNLHGSKVIEKYEKISTSHWIEIRLAESAVCQQMRI